MFAGFRANQTLYLILFSLSGTWELLFCL